MKAIVRDIITATCAHYAIPQDKLLSNRRDRPYSHPRQVAMFLSIAQGGLSLPDAGRSFGRDHTTALYAKRTVQARTEDGDTMAAILAIASEVTRLAREREIRDRAFACRLRAEIAKVEAVTTSITPASRKRPERLPYIPQSARWTLNSFDARAA